MILNLPETDLSELDFKGQTALMISIAHQPDVFEMILEKNPDINQLGEVNKHNLRFKNALGTACHNGNVEHVKALIDRGAHIIMPKQG
jgi:ankyrin repeat protein